MTYRLIRPAATRLFFKFFGSYYDWLMSASYEQQLRQEFGEFASPNQGNMLVEFGCGSGNFLSAAAPYCRKAYGVDVSRNMLNRAEKRLKRTMTQNVELVHSSIEAFEPLHNCDLAVGVAFLYLFDDPSAVLQKMSASIRLGGRVATMDPSPTFNHQNVKDFIRTNRLNLKESFVLRDWLRAVGFYRRFDDRELKELYTGAGLESVELKHTLSGMVVFAKGRKTK